MPPKDPIDLLPDIPDGAGALENAPRKTGIERDIGLAGGSIAKGLMMFPNIVGDAANAAYNLPVMGINKLAGTNIPQLRYPSEVTEQAADELLGAPRTVPEKLADTGIRTLTGAGLMGFASRGIQAAPTMLKEITRAPINKVSKYLPPAPIILDDLINVPRLNQAQQLLQSSAAELAKAPVVQTVGSLGGTLAAEGGKTVTDNPVALTALSVGGGVVSGGSATGVQRTGAGIKELMKPLYAKGREEIVGEALNRVSTNPSLARQTLSDAQEIVPGSRPMVSQVSRDPGLMNAHSAVRGMDDTGIIPQRIAEQNTARIDMLDDLAGDETTLRTLRNVRSKTFDELAEPAFKNAAPVNMGRTWIENPIVRKIQQIRETPEGARETVRKAMDHAQELITQEGVDLTDARTLYAIRKDLALARNGKRTDKPELKFAKQQLGEVVDLLDNKIEEAAPGYRDYMDVFSQRSIPLDQLKAIQKIRNQSVLNITDQINQRPELSANKFIGLLNRNLDEGLNLRGQGPDGAKLTKEQLGTLDRIASDLDRGQAMNAQSMRTGGSDTFKNLTVASVIGRVLGQKTGEAVANTAIVKTAARPLSFLYHVPEREMQQLLLDAWLDPKLAARLMGRATDREIAEIGRELKVRAGQQAAAAGLYSGGE